MKKTRIAGPLVSLMALVLVTAAIAEAESVAAAGQATVAPADASVGRGHMKKMMMNPYMLIPQLITLGFAPIVLANLKMLVMSAMMINNIALNAAIFMIVRNMVFGIRRPTVKYVNHGYDHEHPHDHHYTPHHEPQHNHHPHQKLHSELAEQQYGPQHHQHDQHQRQPEPANYRRKRTIVVAT